MILNAAALAILAEVERGESEWVFPRPGRPTSPINNVDWAWVCVRRRAGLDDARIHDLRHTFASIGYAGGQPLAHIGKLLGHKNQQTTQRYAHLGQNAVRAAADDIGVRIGEAMRAGPEPAANDNLVQRDADRKP